MISKRLLRDGTLFATALACGWTFHSFGARVFAASGQSHAHGSAGSSSPADGLSFAISGPLNGDAALTVYNPESRTLYIYPRLASGSTTIGCEYSLHIDRPGEPIQRQNCAPAPLY